MTIRFAYWLRSEYCEPPKPRLMTSRGFISSTRVSQRAILEEPVKTMHPVLGGLTLSCSSNLRIEDSQSLVWASAVATKQYLRPPTPARYNVRTIKPARALRSISWLLGWATNCRLYRKSQKHQRPEPFLATADLQPSRSGSRRQTRWRAHE